MLCLLHVNKEYPQFGGQKYNSIIKETVKKYARLKILYTSNLLLNKKNKLYVEKTWYICINLNKSKRKKETRSLHSTSFHPHDLQIKCANFARKVSR